MTTHRLMGWTHIVAAFSVVGMVHVGCGAVDDDLEEFDDSEEMAWAGDCDASDQAGDLPRKARSGQVFNARLSYRQTDDAGQGITQACNLASHSVTDQGMRDVQLHCSGRSQSQSGYARVGARWGTSHGAESCNTDFCAVIYVQDRSGSMREVARDIYLKDRFFCSQQSDRNDERLDIDACTYADVIGALKGTGASADDRNLSFDSLGKLTGYSAKGYTLKYKMYECSKGPDGGGGDSGGGGSCTDIPPSSDFTCAQQAEWKKCDYPWMQGFCNKSCGRCSTTCTDVPPSSDFTCAQQAEWKKCDYPWMQGFCNKSCGRC